MPSNYKKICEDNIRRRGEEFDDVGRLISEQLYSERSHFIYELLQNAEDALERRFKQYPDNNSRCEVQFRLFHNRLEFRHFGALFNENDIKGISDVLKGTKKEDFGQIGKFGIGFKSVYAFTASPEIHSGDEHFVINRYIRPEEKIPRHDLEMEDGETVFIFPFDHADLSATEAVALIINKLQELGPRVLLFLRHIDGVEWHVDSDGEKGQYIKETKQIETFGNARHIVVIGQESGHDEEENWLIFNRPVNVPEQDHKVLVELGFRLETGTKDKRERIIRIEQSPLVVYFPTEKETRLGFLIQGPYQTTPARDNIRRDNDWNKKLIKETAELVVESLRHLKKMGLLSVSLLETLPIRAVDFSEESMFFPVYSRVRDALKGEELLPTNDDTFISARNAKLVRGVDLAQLVDQDQLRVLFQFNDETKWLSSNITENRTPSLRSYLINELEIEEVTPEVFGRNLSEQFLISQSDEWCIRFYKYLSGQQFLWRPYNFYGRRRVGILRSKPILRLQDGAHVNPFRPDGSPKAYMAIDGDTESSLPIIKIELSRNEDVHKFLVELGILEVDLVADIIENILPKYRDNSIVVDTEENRHDLKKIEQAYRTDSQEKKARLQKALRNTPFILAQNSNKGEAVYQKPEQVYFESDEVCSYFSGYASFTQIKPNHLHSALFKDLGVEETVRIKRRKRDYQGYVYIASSPGHHSRGLNGYDPGIEVDGSENAIANPNIKRSAFIWNVIAGPNSDCIRGEIELSTRQTYAGSKTKEQTSKFGQLLTNSPWLPDADGKMHKPSELTIDELPEQFKRDEKLADKLGFGMKKDIITRLLEEADIPQKVLDRARQIENATPEVQQQIDILLQGESKRYPQFPEKRIGSLERRGERLTEQYNSANEKEFKPCIRSVRVTEATEDVRFWLKENYTNDEGQMFCQICKEEMPFKKRDGNYYFEAVETLSKNYFPREHETQFLTLCPECAARYKEFVKRDEHAMEELYETLINSEEPEALLKLGDWDTSIRFVETHFHDIKTVLKLVR